MASLTFDALWRDRGVVQGLKTLAAGAEKARQGFDRLGTSTGVFKRLAASSTGASRAGMSIGNNLRSGIIKPLGGLHGIIAGLITGATIGLAKRFADEAGSFNETVSKSRVIFGTSSKAIEQWAKGAANSMGLSTQAALAGTAQFGNFFDQLGFGVKQSKAMSQGFVQMSSDLGSFNDADPAGVMEAFQSATRGEYDALQKFIPTLSAATVEAEAMRQTHKKSTGDLTAADKAAALYSLSVKGMGKAQGDFARTGGGYAGQLRAFAGHWANLRVQIGQHFIPVFLRAAQYMNTEGFPALTRIVDVLGTLGGAAGRMGRAVVKVFTGSFGPAIDGATVNLTELADWFETHQEKMVRFFIRLGDGAIGLGRGIVALAVSGIRSFGDMSGAMGETVRSVGNGIASLMEGAAKLLPPWSDARKDLLRGAADIRTGANKAADGLANTKTKAHEAANAIATKATPAFDKAQEALHRVGEEEVWKAKQRDAAARASIAIRDIGTKADGSQIKLKTWNERTRLGSVEQLRLEGRLKAARTRMLEQREAGIKAGESQKTLTTRWNQGRAALEREFRQMGLSKEEARRLAIRYSQIPKKAETKVGAPGINRTRGAVRGLDTDINNLNNKTVAIKFTAQTFSIGGVKYRVNTTSPSSVGRSATGGKVRGPGTGMSDSVMGVDDLGMPTTRVSKGEWVVNARSSKRHDALLRAINEDGLAAGGRYINIRAGVAPVPQAMVRQAAAVQRFADTFAAKVGPMLGQAVMKNLGGGPIGGGGFATALRWARAQDPAPYRYAAVGPGSYDCSGFVGAIHNVILGRNPHSRRYATGTFLGGPARRAGLTRNKMSPFRIGIIPTGENGGRIGHMAGTLNGVNVESRGGDGVVIGRGARGWNNGLFRYRYGLARGGVVGDPAFDLLDPRGRRYDDALARLYQARRRGRDLRTDEVGLHTGGLVRRPTLARLGERGPERVLPAPVTRTFDRMVRVMERGGGAGGTHVTINMSAPNYVGSEQHLVNALVQIADRGGMRVVLRHAGVKV